MPIRMKPECMLLLNRKFPILSPRFQSIQVNSKAKDCHFLAFSTKSTHSLPFVTGKVLIFTSQYDFIISNISFSFLCVQAFRYQYEPRKYMIISNRKIYLNSHFHKIRNIPLSKESELSPQSCNTSFP